MLEDPTILLVEDNPDDVELVRIAMVDAGIDCQLEVAGDGGEALAYVRGEGAFAGRPRPDLILLDLNLPGIDGREVLRTVKSDATLCTIPVVVMTTSVDDNDVEATYAAHANGFVSKPPDFDELVRLLSSIRAFWFDFARLPGR